MFVLAPNTVWNPAALETRAVPKKVLGRAPFLPRRGTTPALWARLVLENQFLRFSAALTPFVAAMLIWQDLALPISQAPLAMLVVIGVVEMKLLRVPRDKREAMVDEATAARTLDALRFRATRMLARIAARRGLADGRLHLVVEQSELARVPPLTLVSVQWEGTTRELLALDAAERAMLAAELFDAEFPEAALHRANLRADTFLRDVAFDTAGVSAHARLAAMMEAPAPAAAEAPA